MIKTITLSFLIVLSAIVTNAQNTAIMVSDVKVSQSKFQSTALLIKEHMEHSLLEHDFITVVDRDVTYLTERERRVQKSESFMDGKYVDQDKAVGADWIFEIIFNDDQKELTLQILDVETNEKFYADSYKINRFLLADLSVERPRYFGRYIEEKVAEIMKKLDIGSTVNIQLYEIGESKGDKAIEVVLYCKDGCSLKRDMKLKVYEEIKSDTKSLYKKKIEIGEVVVKHVESDKVFIAKVKDGKKEIFKSFQSGNKIICTNED